MPNVQIGAERKIGSVGVKVFRLDVPEHALPAGAKEMYVITMIDKFGHEAAAAIPLEPTEEVIQKAVEIHVRMSQGKTGRN